MNANEKIKKAMRENEQWILKVIRRDGSFPLFGDGIRSARTWNALDRLIAKGRIRIVRTGRWSKAYVMVKKGAK